MRLNGGWHHDHAGYGDQQEVERVHEACPCGLFDLGTAGAAQRAGLRATAAGQLQEERQETRYVRFWNSVSTGCFIWLEPLTSLDDIHRWLEFNKDECESSLVRYPALTWQTFLLSAKLGKKFSRGVICWALINTHTDARTRTRTPYWSLSLLAAELVSCYWTAELH